MRRLLLALVIASAAGAACGFEEGDDDDPVGKRDAANRIRYKLTPTYYSIKNEPAAFDVNLRAGLGDDHNAWLGFYRQGTLFQQLRAGYEREIDFAWGELSLTAMAASRRFVGAGIQAVVGHEVFGIAGWTRTNLRESVNLDFDPDNAVIWGGGLRFGPRTVTSFFQVRDDRGSSGQRINHMVVRIQPVDGQRITLDVYRRTGWNRDDPEDPFAVRATGASITWDIYPMFVRLAFDPKVNFSRNDMWRFALGWRF